MDKKLEQEKAAAEIMHIFRYYYKDAWAPGNMFDGKPRVWIQVFNDLVKKGFIERKKSEVGYSYRWKAQLPENF